MMNALASASGVGAPASGRAPAAKRSRDVSCWRGRGTRLEASSAAGRATWTLCCGSLGIEFFCEAADLGRGDFAAASRRMAAI